jgi:ribose 5-phosphate isomerase RpiB
VSARLIHDHFSAGQAVEDDHMNVICIGGRTVGPGVAWDLVQTFLAAEFSSTPSLAGHLGLDNLCWVYDNNPITIEGATPKC